MTGNFPISCAMTRVNRPTRARSRFPGREARRAGQPACGSCRNSLSLRCSWFSSQHLIAERAPFRRAWSSDDLTAAIFGREIVWEWWARVKVRVGFSAKKRRGSECHRSPWNGNGWKEREYHPPPSCASRRFSPKISDVYKTTRLFSFFSQMYKL